jgi:hypothetical protein
MSQSLAALAFIVVFAACDGPASSSGPKPPPPVAPAGSKSSSDGLPKCASRADVERLHGQKVRVEALYDVTPVPGGKDLEAAYLVLDDGTELIRSYRPVAEELGLVEKRVIAVGTVYRDAGQADHIQQVMAPHFYPDRIELAEGEAKINPPPTERPPPARITRASELVGKKQRWVLVTGTLEGLTPQGNGDWSEGRLKLPSGDAITVAHVYRPRWEELVGAEITVVAKVLATGERPGEAASVSAQARCKGRVERCFNRL